MTRGFVTQDDAFTLVAAGSSNANRKLREIADDVVLTDDAAAVV